ncbi:MAG TPA: hypothetical protein VJ978_05210 [Nitriliruptoraceae bacterium]|nr:hypothetical protein [Nitriliruptoraceae bacterium]
MSRWRRLVEWWRATFRRRRVPGRRPREIPRGMEIDDPRLVKRDDSQEWGSSSTSFQK